MNVDVCGAIDSTKINNAIEAMMIIVQLRDAQKILDHVNEAMAAMQVYKEELHISHPEHGTIIQQNTSHIDALPELLKKTIESKIWPQEFGDDFRSVALVVLTYVQGMQVLAKKNSTPETLGMETMFGFLAPIYVNSKPFDDVLAQSRILDVCSKHILLGAMQAWSDDFNIEPSMDMLKELAREHHGRPAGLLEALHKELQKSPKEISHTGINLN